MFSISKYFIVLVAFLVLVFESNAQPVDASTIYSSHTLYGERVKRREGMYKYSLLPLLKLTPDTNNLGRFQSALWVISQYILKNDTTRQLVDTLFAHYADLDNSTRRSLMEVVYGLYPTEYISNIQQLWPSGKDDRLLAIMIYYLRRNGTRLIDEPQIEKWVEQNRSWIDTSVVLQQLISEFTPEMRQGTLPQVTELFENQQRLGCKIIYSLQRSDRNFPGLAIIQNADGSFVKDSSSGRLKTFVQLARSASNLPYFITNGSTPQGIYRIKGTDVSLNNFIGPTPNIQLRMPYEIPGDSFFVQPVQPIATDSLFYLKYNNLLPTSWRNSKMLESYYAGKCGRGAIIAHGTTIDPWYYRQQPFYPCTPTLGCLCAKEIWNPNTGKLIQSDQLALVNAFLATQGTDGYLFVINIDNKKAAVTPEEVMAMVKAFENK